MHYRRHLVELMALPVMQSEDQEAGQTIENWTHKFRQLSAGRNWRRDWQFRTL